MNYKYTIGAVSKKTGLSSNLIRMWELRYAAVVPSRSPTNRRLYSSSDIERLILLKNAIDIGMSIGSVVSLSTEQLVDFIETNKGKEFTNQFENQASTRENQSYEYHLGNCFECIEKYDTDQLQNALGRAAIYLNDNDLLQFVIKPLLLRVRELSKRGILNKLQEKLVFNETRSFLLNWIDSFAKLPKKNKIVILRMNESLNNLSALIAGVIYCLKGHDVLFMDIEDDLDSLKQHISEVEPVAVVLINIFPEEAELIANKSIEIDEMMHSLNNTRLLIFDNHFVDQNDVSIASL